MKTQGSRLKTQARFKGEGSSRRQGGRAAARAGAFTLVEVLIASAMTAVVLVAVLTGVVTLQRSYAATESYANGQADQQRLLDYLALDLRRSVTAPPAPPSTAPPAPYTMDPDGLGLKITVPDYYHFNGTDPQHQFPIANAPTYDQGTGAAFYSSTGATSANPLPCQTIAYRFNNGAVTRSDPWAPLVSDGKGGYVPTGPVVIASNMTQFPVVAPEKSDPSGDTVGYQVQFYSIFQPLAAGNPTNLITLRNVTFIRSKNLVH